MTAETGQAKASANVVMTVLGSTTLNEELQRVGKGRTRPHDKTEAAHENEAILRNDPDRHRVVEKVHLLEAIVQHLVAKSLAENRLQESLMPVHVERI